jgi:hypothetical protein
VDSNHLERQAPHRNNGHRGAYQVFSPPGIPPGLSLLLGPGNQDLFAKGKNVMLTGSLTPAYGRDYKSKAALKADWNANKDFVFHNMHSPHDGDKHDLTFLHARPCVVGLRAKGKARCDTSGFVVRS